MAWTPSYDADEVKEAVASSTSVAEVLRKLGLRAAGHNARTLRRLTEHYGIDAVHLQAGRVRRTPPPRHATPLSEILIEGSSYHRGHLKERLYAEGVKERRCELCGQDEMWRGRAMALILDHINGVPDDHRLENLQIVCPNCAATLDTHCGRKHIPQRASRPCARCGLPFRPKHRAHRYCSRACGSRHANRRRGPNPARRTVARPSHAELLADLATMTMVAVARRYGVSDTAVRKWLRAYDRAAEAGGEEGLAIALRSAP